MLGMPAGRNAAVQIAPRRHFKRSDNYQERFLPRTVYFIDVAETRGKSLTKCRVSLTKGHYKSGCIIG